MARSANRYAAGSTVRIFLLAFVAYAYFMPRWADWNTDSRLDLVHAVVDHHTLRIDRYHWNTWDKAIYKGHYYSDKAPGAAALGVIVYAGFVGFKSLPVAGGIVSKIEKSSAWNPAIALGRSDTQVRPIGSGHRLGGCRRAGVKGRIQYIPWGNRLVPPEREWALSKYVIAMGVDALISAPFVAFLFWFLGFFLVSLLFRWILVGLYALGTVALPYSTIFYSHQLVAACLFTAFALLFLYGRNKVRGWALPVAGFLLGFALFTEYTVAIVLACLGVYAVWLLRRRPTQIVPLLVAGSVPVLALLAYNWACFGNAFDTGYSHDFCWSAVQAQGIDGFTYPQLRPLLDLTFGSYRGLFYMSPFLLLALPGVILAWRRGYRLEQLVSLGVAVIFILAISAFWGWNGGRVEGPRYLVPIVPFLVFPIIFFLQSLPRFRVGWLILLVTGVWSLFVTIAEFLGGALFPVSWDQNPLVQYSLPALAGNRIAPNAGLFLGLQGWPTLLPLIALLLLIGLWPGRLQPLFRSWHSSQPPVSSLDV